MEKKIVNQVFFLQGLGFSVTVCFFKLQWNLSTGLLGRELVLQAVRLQKWQ